MTLKLYASLACTYHCDMLSAGGSSANASTGKQELGLGCRDGGVGRGQETQGGVEVMAQSALPAGTDGPPGRE